jgi:hypothetical protein
MKGVFWNSRGLGDLAKHRFLEDLVKEERHVVGTGEAQGPN